MAKKSVTSKPATPDLATVCRVLNRLFWTLPGVPGTRTNTEQAKVWLAELRDIGVDVTWSPTSERFYVPKRRTQ
jgi:hypothetical protein